MSMSRGSRVRAVAVVVTSVVVVAGSATVVSGRTNECLMTVMSLSRSITDALIDNGKHGLGPRNEIRGS
jgi:hypothetical protein